MRWLFSRLRSSRRIFAKVPAPWDADRRSIYAHIKANLHPSGLGLLQDGYDLSDEPLDDGDTVRWTPGARDGVMGHHGATTNKTLIDDTFEALRQVTADACGDSIRRLYNHVCDDRLLVILDDLIDRVLTADGGQAIPDGPLFELAAYFAIGAPDRGAVKFAIAMLGLYEHDQSSEILFTLGRHEEFTLFVAVAFARNAKDRDGAIWKLAKSVEGWGRIHCVERLEQTDRPDIKAWLLRDGFRNEIMNEYLADVAARGGGLVEELRSDNPDDALLESAGDILSAMARGQPGLGMSAYEASAEATERYLGHMTRRIDGLDQLNVVGALSDFATKQINDNDDDLAAAGWSAQRCAAIIETADRILKRSEWHVRIVEALERDDATQFWEAKILAPRFGIDIWEICFKRQQDGSEDHWFDLMQTDDPSRIDKVLELAERQIKLEEIVTNSSNSALDDFGSKHHIAFEFIVQELHKFPKKGWSYLRV